MESVPLERIDEDIWEIPTSFREGMRVPGRVYADEELIEGMKGDRTLLQCSNVAHLPGIYKFAVTLPDGHEGYGFPIGGVAATDYEEGVISPGGVGYDINCGVRLLTTNIDAKDLEPRVRAVAEILFKRVPSGLGSQRKQFRLDEGELKTLVEEGASWLIERGMGRPEDAGNCEEQGSMAGADPEKLSKRALQRGLAQVGTLGSGNHFLEVQRVDEIYQPETAKTFGIHSLNQVTVMIHTGSRGFGHQVCSDYLKTMDGTMEKYHVRLPDRELACAPAQSPEAADYRGAMACAVNFAFCNRQSVTHWVRESFEEVLGHPSEDMGLDIVYDVAHNIAKLETHTVEGVNRRVWVHRKGATRAFPPGSAEIPARYRGAGQPVFIPGTMGTSSFVLAGAPRSMELTFGSTPHGAGRVLSRSAAKRSYRGEEVQRSLRERGIHVLTDSMVGLAEEASGAYKNVERVVDVSDRLGIGIKVARLRPIAVVKG